jgi:hypothetical protein
MQTHPSDRHINPVVTFCSVCLVMLLTGVWATAQPEPAAPDDAAAQPAPAEGYRTHVSTDKPIYRGGETVYIRGVVMEAVNNKPLPDNAVAAAEIEIVGPKGDTVAKGALTSEKSVLGFSWQVPDDQPGGEYSIKVKFPWQGYAPAERKFDIRQYRAPRLKTQIVFVRDGYGPGDTVNASVNITRAEGGVPDGAKITAVARVDGKQVHRGKVAIDGDGNASATFKLPGKIERGEGTLAFIIEDGGVVETATKTIPILLQTVDLGIYPESGDLVAGLESRVYIEVKTPWGKPADIEAVIEDTSLPGMPGKVAEVATFHEGRGQFAFTPMADHAYQLRITKPTGMDKAYPLPKVKASGAILSAMKNVYNHDEPITLKVGAAGVKPGKVVITKAGQTLGEAEPKLSNDVHISRQKATIALPADAAGVLVATLYDADGKPLAERLVYRKPAKQVNIQISTAKTHFTPGDQVELQIRTTDANGQPIGAVVGLSVTDDSVLEMIDKREQAPRLPAMVLLGSDVRDLADAHVYLDPDKEKAEPAIDLLLGTQGWRRFAFVDVDKFLRAHGEDAHRVTAVVRPDRRHEHDILHTEFGRLGFDKDHSGQLVYVGQDIKIKSELKGATISVVDPREIRRAMVVDAVMENAAILPGAAMPDAEGAEKAAPDAEAAPEPPAKPAARPFKLERPKQAQGKIMAGDAIMMEEDIAEREMPIIIAPQRQRNDFVVVREYAHSVRPNRQPGQRVDFTETLYFHAGVATDGQTGEATVTFGLSDSVTSFRVTADGFDAGGALGSNSTLVESVQPFYIEPKMPLELTQGDLVQLPIALVNATENSLDGVDLTVQTDERITITTPSSDPLAAGGRVRQIVSVDTGSYVGTTPFAVAAKAGPLADRNTRTLVVKPQGFPSGIAFGGMIEGDSPVALTFNVPRDYVAHSMTTDIRVFPSPVANMTTAMERLIREPHGCFEQTSSTNYPLAMAQQYFTTHQGVDPALIERAGSVLAKGYQRLLSFECSERGYEWFGENPGHEALTAYGLMEFVDMSKTMQVDQDMIAHTRKWLMAQRDGEGNFKRGRPRFAYLDRRSGLLQRLHPLVIAVDRQRSEGPDQGNRRVRKGGRQE